MPKEELEKIKRVDIGDLTESIATAVQRVIEAGRLDRKNPFSNPRIICGFILEPQLPFQVPSQTARE